MLIAVITSPGSIACSLSGVAPGSRKKSSTGDRALRSPEMDRCVEARPALSRDRRDRWRYRPSLVPSTAWPRVTPLIAEQPLPGERLLQAGKFAGSRKYGQRVRCIRLPPMVAMLRSCARGRLPQRFRDGWEPALDVGMVGDAAHLASAPMRSAASSTVDAIQSVEMGDVDQPFRVGRRRIWRDRSASCHRQASMAPGSAAAWRAASCDNRRASIGKIPHGCNLQACLAHGGDDVRIGAAAAEIAGHVFADLVIRAGMALADAGHRRHDLARRAVAALEGVMFEESGLHGVQCHRPRQVLRWW